MTDLDTVLDGNVTLSTNHAQAVLQGPFEQALKWPLRCHDGRRQFDGTQFPPLEVMDLPRITVKRVDLGQGSFDPASGRIELPIKLRVKYPLGAATVALTLSTAGDGGSPVDPASGQVRLVAAGDFDDSFLLKGVRCTLAVVARFTPNPRA